MFSKFLPRFVALLLNILVLFSTICSLPSLEASSVSLFNLEIPNYEKSEILSTYSSYFDEFEAENDGFETESECNALDISGCNNFPKFRVKRAAKDTDAFNGVQIVPQNYSSIIPPTSLNGGPTLVNFSIIIINIRDIHEIEEDISLEMNMRIFWVDNRLDHLLDVIPAGESYLSLNPEVIKKIWTPDVTIIRVKSLSQQGIISDSASVRIYKTPEGAGIRYSFRLTAAISCKMNFKFFPADIQLCPIDFQSYAYFNHTQLLLWENVNQDCSTDCVKIENAFLPTNFEVGLEQTNEQKPQKTNSGTYSGIQFVLKLRRRLGYHLLQTYLPSLLLIIISWLGYLVPLEAIAGRMALSNTILLTLTVMFNSVSSSTPKVSYLRGMDIWIISCIICVFLTLVEYTFLLKLRARKLKMKEKKRRAKALKDLILSPVNKNRANRIFGRSNEAFDREIELNTFQQNFGQNLQNPISPNQTQSKAAKSPIERSMSEQEKWSKERKEVIIKRIERFTFLICPGLFLIFNCFYWPWLLRSTSNEGYFDFKTYKVFDKPLIFINSTSLES